MAGQPSDPREREFKYDLGDEAAARRLEALLPPAQGARRQVNRFFDTAGRDLRRRRLALRLRGEWALGAPAEPPPTVPSATHAATSAAAPPSPPEAAPERVILSLKGPRQGAGDLHDRPELQVELAREAWGWRELSPADLPQAWLTRLPPLAEPLSEAARFANVRRTHPLTARWRAEIDRTEFGDGRRAWELELEIGPGDDPAEARRLVLDLLGRAGVAARPQRRSKLERALGTGG